MEVILLGIYSFFVWLIFIKLKLLPWNTPWKVAVVIFPVVCIVILLLLLNIVAPTTSDVRVVKYVVPVVSQVRGRVTEVPVENNRPVKKGDVLFKIDPTPYQNDVHSLEARLLADEAKVGADLTRLAEARAKLTDAQSAEPQLREQLNQATAQVASLNASITLARTRVDQNTEARRRRRRKPFRPRTVADHAQRAQRAARGGARRRTAGPRKTRQPRWWRSGLGRAGQVADRHRRSAGEGLAGAGRDDARASSKPRSSTSRRPRCMRRRTARW